MQKTGSVPLAGTRRIAALASIRSLVATHWMALLAAGLTVALGAPSLLYPYGPDQALFAYFGERILHGAALYVDVWDVKPPGIFWVYTLIAALPGPEMRVLRLFDLLWAGGTVLAIYAVAARYWNRMAGGVAGAIYGAVYVVATGYWHSAQPDSFMVAPMMLALLAYDTARARRSSGWAVTAGLLLGLCMQFRPVVVFVPAALAVLDLWQTPPPARRTALGRVAALIGGGIALEALTLAWLALHGAVGEYLYAQLVFAGQYGRQGGPYSPDGLTLGNYLSGQRTGTMFIIFARMIVAAPALFAVVVGGVIRRDRQVVLVSWLAAAAFAGVAVQGKFFLYHWHLLLPFLALLTGWSAAFAWRALRDAGRSPVAAAFTTAAIGALLVFLTPNVSDRLAVEWQDAARYVRDPGSRSAYGDKFGLYARGSFSYRASDEAAAYIRARTRPDDTVMVWGYDPLLYVLSERDSPSRFISFLPLMSTWTPPAWVDEFVDDLERRRPAYIVLQRGENARWITGHDIDAPDYVDLLPRFRALLDRDYAVERQIEDYTLYRRRD